MDRADRADRLKYALFLGQGPVIERLLTEDPTLAVDNPGMLCALYDAEEVAALLAEDPEAATLPVGVRTPILHLAFSRYHQVAPERAADALAVAEALVVHGADVNDSYAPDPGTDHRLSALYGALGHAGNLPLAAWLLEHGADPNDNESLYHAAELGHADGLRLLLRHGARPAGTNALARVLDFDLFEGAALLLDHGADPNEDVADHPSGEPPVVIPALHQAARRGRDARFAHLLLKHGADPTARWEGHSAYGMARIYGNASFAEALEQAGHATPLGPAEILLAACADGTVPPDRPLASMALGPEEAQVLNRIIVDPGRLDHARRLVAAGLEPNLTDELEMPALHHAGWSGLPEALSWLLTLNPLLSHVNGYGGDLLHTIMHGSENAPKGLAGQDHAACARAALDAGMVLRPSHLRGIAADPVMAVLHAWAEDHPGSIAEEG